MRELSLDGQRVLLPDDDTLDALEASPVLEGRQVGVGGLLSRYRALGRHEPALAVGLGDRREPGAAWVVLHVLRLGDELLRVHVESQACAGCGATYLTALTRHYNLYEGTPDPLAALLASSRPTVPCPACGAELDQPPVWLSPARGPVR